MYLTFSAKFMASMTGVNLLNGLEDDDKVSLLFSFLLNDQHKIY